MYLIACGSEAGEPYLRAGIGLDYSHDTAFTDVDCSSIAPAALYGCGTDGDGATYRSHGEFGTAISAEIGLGYATEGVARFEAVVEYRPNVPFVGRANFLAPDRQQSVSAELSSLSGMLAGFLDLAARERPGAGPLTPFIGAGIGVAHARIGETTMTFPSTTTTVPGGSRVNLTWMATAGFAVALNERLSLDVAWRYTDLGEIRTARGEGQVVWRDYRREPLPLDLAPTRANIEGHGLRLSLRGLL